MLAANHRETTVSLVDFSCSTCTTCAFLHIPHRSRAYVQYMHSRAAETAGDAWGCLRSQIVNVSTDLFWNCMLSPPHHKRQALEGAVGTEARAAERVSSSELPCAKEHLLAQAGSEWTDCAAANSNHEIYVASYSVRSATSGTPRSRVRSRSG